MKSKIFYTVLSLVISFFLLMSLRAYPQNVPEKKVFYSQNVKDSFAITIILPENYTTTKKYNTVFFLDAGIKSGSHFIRLLKNKENTALCKKTVFIGIGHKGNYNVLRRRDFIPPLWKNGSIEKSKDKDYGHADKFYLFIEKELIPFLEQNYSVNNTRSIIGHSFGGLFVYYCLLKEKRLFKNLFALSPSLWVNTSNIFEYEQAFFKSNKSLEAYLYMANGSLEFANFVLTSNRRMNLLLKKRSYKGLQYIYKEKQFANHNSHIPLTLQEVLNLLRDKK